jgi:hypothetical protein
MSEDPEQDHEDDCIYVRTEVWLDLGDGARVKVRTRKFCAHGAFLDYTGLTLADRVEVIFPEPGADQRTERALPATVIRRDVDGIWVRFTHAIRSPSEMLMRHGLSGDIVADPAGS